MRPPIIPCLNTCIHFRDDGPKYPNSGTCKAATDAAPDMRLVWHSNQAMTFHCRRADSRQIRGEQEALF